MTDEGIEILANAIILQAVKDYRKALKGLSLNGESSTAVIADCERFFRSEWYRQLTNVDGEYLIATIRKEGVKKQVLKDIRESRGMSQQDLADKSGINKRKIQAYEQGYRDINGAKLSTLLAFANALNCPIDQIVTDESLIALIKACREKI